MKFTDTAIVTDLDGTFFNSKTELVKRNLDAISYYKQNGGLFAVATGRVPEMLGILEPMMPSLVNIPCINCNGAFAYDFQEMRPYNEIFLDADKATEYVKLVNAAFPEVGTRLSCSKGKYVIHETKWSEPTGRTIASVTVDEAPRCGWYRVAFDGPCEQLDAIREKFESGFTEYFDFVKSGPMIYEFNDKSATKGTALVRLKKLLIDTGRATENLRIYAVGDYENDLDMLRHADVPCCPANAIDEVKKVAKLHVCHCDDGAIADVIDAIEKSK